MRITGDSVSEINDAVREVRVRGRLIPREGIVLQDEPVLDPPLGASCSFLQGARLENLVFA
jgi:hypothetical protein